METRRTQSISGLSLPWTLCASSAENSDKDEFRSGGYSLVLIITILLGLAACVGRQPQPMMIFAAASLTDVVEALADSFSLEKGVPASVNVAASSTLSRQIEFGAHADVFISADTSWADRLVRERVASSSILLPVGNVIVAAYLSSEGSARSFAGLTNVSRVAMGDPTHVPAGEYARRTLVCAALWDSVRPRAVTTIDVRAALAALVSGSVDGAIVYASDVARDRRFVAAPAPDSCRVAVDYRAVIPNAAALRGAASDFVLYISSPQRRSTWERFGFRWLGAIS